MSYNFRRYSVSDTIEMLLKNKSTAFFFWLVYRQKVKKIGCGLVEVTKEKCPNDSLGFYFGGRSNHQLTDLGFF